MYGGSRVSDAQLVSATAFAAVDGEGCTKLLKEKVVALSKAVGLDETAALAKDQLLKYTLGWTRPVRWQRVAEAATAR